MKLSAFGIVQIVAIVLKLTGYLPIAWWVVCIPLELWALAIALYCTSQIVLLLTETPEERKLRKAREAFEAYRRRLGFPIE